MHRTDGTENLVRRLRIIALCALFVSGVAWALDSITPAHYRYTGTTGTGVNTTATWRLAKSGAPSLYAERQFATSFSSLGGVAKRIIRRGVGVGLAYEAAKAIVEGAGWAISELQSQVVTSEPKSSVQAGERIYVFAYNNFVKKYSTHYQACQAVFPFTAGDPYAPTYSTPQQPDGDYNGLHCHTNYGRFNAPGIFVITSQVVSTQTAVDDAPPPEVSDEELGQKIAESPDAVNKLLEAGGVVQMTPELLAQQNALKAAKAAEAGEPAPTPDVMPTAEQQAEQKPADEEWPKFCTWAGVVCDFIDWFKKDDTTTDKPELPTEDVALPSENWNSGLPSDASCPSVPAISFSLMGQSVNQEVSIGPLCTAAEMFRPFVIALSVLIAAYIIGGVRNDA